MKEDVGWFRVRNMSYRAQDTRMDGLVMTFADISASKKVEAQLGDAQARLQVLTTAPKSRRAGHGVS